MGKRMVECMRWWEVGLGGGKLTRMIRGDKNKAASADLVHALLGQVGRRV